MSKGKGPARKIFITSLHRNCPKIFYRAVDIRVDLTDSAA